MHPAELTRGLVLRKHFFSADFASRNQSETFVYWSKQGPGIRSKNDWLKL